jgi:F-type H+-transporting ATPase subunit c
MKKYVFVILIFLALTSIHAFAQEEVEGSATKDSGQLISFGMIALACVIGVGIGAAGVGIGQGLATKGAVEGIARNPGTSGKVTVTLIIGLAMMESLVIYALVVALIILFR